jgi:hypothetical protein
MIHDPAEGTMTTPSRRIVVDVAVGDLAASKAPQTA